MIHNVAIMLGVMTATAIAAVVTWTAPRDAWALAAGLVGTYGMFMLEGIPMRWLLAVAAFCWVVSNLLVGSLGGTLAEALILATNLITIARLHKTSHGN